MELDTDLDAESENKREIIVGIDIGIRNLAFCVLSYDCCCAADSSVDGNQNSQIKPAIETWEVIDILQDNGIRRKRARHLNRVLLCRLIGASMSKREHLWKQARTIVVESQPATGGALVAQTVLMWFHQMKYDIVSQHASMKLKLNLNMITNSPPTEVVASSKNTYHQRKKRAVALVNWIIDEKFIQINSDNLTLWRSTKKKDDLADACLHALVFIQRKSRP